MSRRGARAGAVVVLAALTVTALTVGAGITGAAASTPDGTTLAAPAAGSTTQPQTYSGAIPTGSANPTSACPGTTGAVDNHTIHWAAQPDPQTTRSSFTVTISWTPSSGNETANDEVLTVFDSAGTALASSDGSDPSESVTLVDQPTGDYTAVACGYLNTTSQPYSGTVTATSVAVRHAPPPVAETSGGATAAPGLPEAPYAVALPLLALVGAGVLFVARRQRQQRRRCA